MPTREEIKNVLQRAVVEKDVSVRNIEGEDKFKITTKGLEKMGSILKNSPEMQLHLFYILLKQFKKAKLGWRKSVKKAVKIMEDRYNPDFLLLVRDRLFVKDKDSQKWRRFENED